MWRIYVGGETVGTDEDGELYKGEVCFMIIGLKNNIPYIISTVSGRKNRGEWLKDELCTSLHASATKYWSTSVSAHKKHLAEYSDSSVELYISWMKRKYICSLIRLTRKRFLFPSLNFDDIYDNVHVAGGELALISQSLRRRTETPILSRPSVELSSFTKMILIDIKITNKDPSDTNQVLEEPDWTTLSC